MRGTIGKPLSDDARPDQTADGKEDAAPAPRQDRSPVPSAFDYAPAPEARDIVRLEDRYGLFVGGEWVEPHSGEFQPSISPATEEPLAEVAYGDAQDVDAAVKAARDAFENGWSDLEPSERAKYLYRIARILQERSREFAVLESLDGGKPIKESRDVDLPLAAAHFFYYAGWADKLEYAFPNRRPRPLGVAAQVIPWNFPLLMLSWKIAPALAAGNTVVLKPAETTPLTALLFADVLRQAGLPPGVVNIVTGDGRAGAELVKHPDVDKVAFTGSTDVGKEIQRAVAGTDKRLTLELGGKAANIIFDDASLDQAVEGIVNGIYFNQGHVCCAGSRLLVQESIYERRSWPSSSGAWRRSASATRSTRTRTSVPSTRSSSSTGSRSSSRAGRRRAPRSTSRRAACPRRAGCSRRPSSRRSRRATGSRRRRSSGPCSRCSPSARRTRRSRRRTTPLRALGRRLDGEGLADPLDGAAAPGGRRVGEHVQPLRSRVAVRRLQGVWLRPRGRPPRPRGVH